MAFGAPSSISLKGRALRWLAQREHSRAELARKLARYAAQGADQGIEKGIENGAGAGADGNPGTGDDGAAADRIAALLDELAALGLLSDERAAASVLAAQAPRGGERRLKQALQQRGLDADLVERTLAQARPGEFERARALWQRRFGAPPADAAERARQMRFLAGRGFAGDIVRRVVRGAEEE
ncbi:MAG: regulatory protein RecX [Rubrivivax sp.]|nr:regulatory protein RecX [Rubrivivax sp.]